MILDADGKPTGESDIQYMVPMLFQWLSDAGVRARIVGRGIYTQQNIAVLGGLLYAAHRDGMPFPEETLRKHVHKILSDRVVRISIARKIYVDTLAVAHAWETRCLTYESNPVGVDPRLNPPAPLMRRAQYMKGLQEMREEFEARFESVIIRPN